MTTTEEAFLAKLVADAKASKAPFYSVPITLSPDLAKALLDRTHTNQRKLREHRVAQLTSDVEKNGWAVTGDPLHLDVDGRFINGQHRATVVLRTGISYPTQLVVTRDPHAVHAIDQTAVRTATDVYRFATGEIISASTLAAIVLEATDFPARHRRAILQPSERGIVVKNYDLLPQARLLAGQRATAGALAGALRCVRWEPVRAMAFFDAAFKEQHHIDNVPISQLQVLVNKYADLRVHPKASNIHPLYCAWYAMSAFRAWAEARPVTHLQAPTKAATIDGSFGMPVTLAFIERLKAGQHPASAGRLRSRQTPPVRRGSKATK